MILIIDDDQEIVTLISDTLRDEGYRVHADLGWRALQFAEEQHPDLVLLDLMMPLLSGGQILDYLQHEPTTAAIPVVVLTGIQDVREEVTQLGAAGVLAKPFDLRDLVTIVARYCRQGDDRVH